MITMKENFFSFHLELLLTFHSISFYFSFPLFYFEIHVYHFTIQAQAAEPLGTCQTNQTTLSPVILLFDARFQVLQ